MPFLEQDAFCASSRNRPYETHQFTDLIGSGVATDKNAPGRHFGSSESTIRQSTLSIGIHFDLAHCPSQIKVGKKTESPAETPMTAENGQTHGLCSIINEITVVNQCYGYGVSHGETI